MTDRIILDKSVIMPQIDVVLDEGAKMPTKGHEDDAAFDLYIPENEIVHACEPGHSIVIDTGVRMAIPYGYAGVMISKSGLNVKNGINTTGLIDSGYTGSIIVKAYNHGDTVKIFSPGDKIAQIMIVPCLYPELNQVEKLEETERGANGFGSTGK